MDTDVHISGLEVSAWVIQARTLGYGGTLGWVIGMNCGNFTYTQFCIMDDFGYLVEVPAPWQR